MSACFSPLAISVRQATLAAGLSGAMLVGVNAWADPVAYSIPAGSLAAAINQFATVSGVTVSFSNEQTAGLRSQGLQGSYEPEQGLARLLQGSGLQMQRAADKRYLLAQPAPGAGRDHCIERAVRGHH
ncbi:TonB-dependent siderophore receptor [Pseudomonas sp. StFLB209]|nr:STN domain-containing protein [Pseudomonas sp. StFLB209]BAP45377.1 TonB-dependent siderophore receptor [Pseudomonas sp. StFLB209]